MGEAGEVDQRGCVFFFSSELSLGKMRTGFSILIFGSSNQYWKFLSCELWTVTLQLLYAFASINFKAKCFFFFPVMLGKTIICLLFPLSRVQLCIFRRMRLVDACDSLSFLCHL